MLEPKFKHTFCLRLGEFLDWLKGPSRTTVIKGPHRTRLLTLETDDVEDQPRAIIRCVRQVFLTRYKRWWVPTRRRTTYTVSITVDLNYITRYGANTFADKVYPLLCTRLLEWTTYPHICAIEAYADALYEELRVLRNETTSTTGSLEV